MLRNPLSSRNAVATPPTESHAGASKPPSNIPSIRLISATPSASGNTSAASTSLATSAVDPSWDTSAPPLPPLPAPVLAPKPSFDGNPTRVKRLVPKKSKLNILSSVGVGRDREKERDRAKDVKEKDLSDVMRRVGASESTHGGVGTGGFEIYVDPTLDPELGEILMVKKKKSRAALDGLRWGPGALGEVTNVPSSAKGGAKEAPALLKVKNGEEKESKWWSIGRGRKDSKEKDKKETKAVARAKSPEVNRDPQPRSKTPEPLKLTEQSRARFNSLDSGIILNTPINMGPVAEVSPMTYSRAGTPTAGGFLAPPAASAPAAQQQQERQGSIALRAIRSVRSLARIGSWAQLRNSAPLAEEKAEGAPAVSVDKKEKERTIRGKSKVAAEEGEKKKKKTKKAKTAKEGEDGTNGEKKKKVKEKKEKEKKDKKEKEKAQTLRLSSSSFEIGTASPLRPQSSQTLGKKKVSILGLGLPSSMRLPSMRSGSTASSNMHLPFQQQQHPSSSSSQRLSVGSAAMMIGRDRSASVLSTSTTGSSLRPISVTSSASGGGGVAGSRMSTSSSIRWDEEGIVNAREARRREREEELEKKLKGVVEDETEGKSKKKKRKGEKENRESRRTSDGRRRTPISEIFPAFASPAAVEKPADGAPAQSVRSTPERPVYPIVTIQAATLDGHSTDDDGEPSMSEPEASRPLSTPVKRARARPLSEQMLGRTRPKAMYESEDGVLSILDAATNDLAQLINNLDLQATPATPDMTPHKRSPSSILRSLNRSNRDSPYGEESPTKPKSLRAGRENDSPLSTNRVSPKATWMQTMSSVASLKPYAQSRGTVKAKASNDTTIGQQIAPWPVLMKGLSPVKDSPKVGQLASHEKATLRSRHKRTLTPGPEPEPAPVFQPLKPFVRSKRFVASSMNGTLKGSAASLAVANEEESEDEYAQGTVRALSSMTFGPVSVASSRAGSKGSINDFIRPSDSPVFKRVDKRMPGDESGAEVIKRKKTSRDSNGSSKKSLKRKDRIPISPRSRKVLGMSGTMGGSDVSAYAVELDPSDPDSDIPEELQVILSGQSDDGDTFSYCEPSPPATSGESAPAPPVPVFRAQVTDDNGDHGLDVDEEDEDTDTKKSFDFTGEIQKLNESGASDRRSFVEQLENAFRTPVKVDLKYDFDYLAAPDIPPVPKIPPGMESASSQEEIKTCELPSGNSEDERIADVKEPNWTHLNVTAVSDSMDTSDSVIEPIFEMVTGSRLLEVREPTLLPGSDSLASRADDTEGIVPSEDVSDKENLRESTSTHASRPSDGQLNRSFRFGGIPRAQASPETNSEAEGKKPLTLSDIIPPPSHVRSLSNSSIMEEDDSVLKSIYEKASNIPRPRLNSDSSSKRLARGIVHARGHSRHSSGLSFAGFESFDEVRRGFEFGRDCVPFYPPAANTRRVNHNKHESLFSIASVSSYGRVINNGVSDPFDYGLPSLRERPSSEDMSSFSLTVDDTFSFLGRTRRRVDSDASSFYFKAPFSRGHRRHESNMSVASQGPPVSLYNRSFAAHRRNDSGTSASSVAQSYAMYGANGGRAAWARHRQNVSADSIMSDFSAMRLGRPGLGDKMFDTAGDYGVPLTAISASPPNSSTDQQFGNRSSFEFDSIMDAVGPSSEEGPSYPEDSLFDRTGQRTSSVSDDSVFGSIEVGRAPLAPAFSFRPVSILSMGTSHSPRKEDDTMISMLGGGHVRRRSIDASPCVRIEKRKHALFQLTQGLDGKAEHQESPNKARILEKPSIASTSSFSFGDERMIRAKHGLLERQSLEDSCLIAEGEDVSASFHDPVFSRPPPANRSRSSTCTSSSGGDTPPLSISDGFSSMSDGSQSSIDLSRVNLILANVTHPMTANHGRRTRARGQGHRRRFSRNRASRTSVYETIEEETSNAPTPHKASDLQAPGSKKDSPTVCQPIFIVDSDAASIDSSRESSTWDDERGIVTLRKYYALRDEAQDTVKESKRLWIDTPFSIFALQSFQPPRHPAGMQALLEHSIENYGPLPSELRLRRVRTHSRPSPYPQRTTKVVPASPVRKKQSTSTRIEVFQKVGTPVLQEKPINSNKIPLVAPSLEALKPFSPLAVNLEPKKESILGLPRPRVPSAARRTALGWTKRSTGKTSTEGKENAIGQGTVMTPGESLRINRPRPRGRPTPAAQRRSIRV